MEKDMSFIGVWFTPNSQDKAPGKLSLDLQTGKFTLEFSKPREENETYIRFTKDERVFPCIWGKANSGEYITLLNCFLLNRSGKSSETTRRYQFHIETVIVGSRNVDPETTFRCFILDIPELVAWAKLSTFELDIKSTKEENFSFSYDWMAKKPKIFNAKEDLLVRISPSTGDLSSIVSTPSLILTQSVQVEFMYRTPASIKELWNDFLILIDIINLGYQSNITRNTVSAYICDACLSSSYSTPFTIFSSFPTNEVNHAEFYDYLFDLEDLDISTEIVTNWFLKRALLEPIINLYNDAILNPAISVIVSFLNLVQALEIYHSRFIANSKQDYQQRIEKILATIGSHDNSFHKKHLLPNSFKNENDIRLIHRLSDLFTCNFDVHFCTIDNKVWPYSYLDRVVETRNYYTHYNPEKETTILKGNDLLTSLLCLQTVLEYYLLKELGFPGRVLDSLLKNRNNKIKLQRQSID